MAADLSRVLSLGMVVSMRDLASVTSTRIGRSLTRLEGSAADASAAVAQLTAALGALFVGGKVVDFFQAAVREAADFEFVMTNVKRIVGDSVSDLDELSTAFIRLSNDIPASARDLGTVAQQLARMGLFAGEGSQEIAEISRSVVQFATAAGLPFEQASTSLGIMLNQFQLLNKEGMRNRDVINSVASSLLKMDVSSLGTADSIFRMTQRFGTLSQNFDLSIDEAFALSAAIQNLIGPTRVEPGGSALLKLFGQMAKDTAGFARITGIAKSELDGFAAGTKPAIQFVQLFADALRRGGAEGENMDVVLQKLQLADSRQVTALKALASESNNLTKLLRDSNIAFNNGTEVINQYSTMMETLFLKLQQLRSSVTNVLTIIGEPLAAAFVQLINAAQRVLNVIVSMPPALVGAIGVLFAIVTAFALWTAAMIAWEAASFLIGAQLIAMTSATSVAGIAVRTFSAALRDGVGHLMAFRLALDSAVTSMQANAAAAGASSAALGAATGAQRLFGTATQQLTGAQVLWNAQTMLSTKLAGILTGTLKFAAGAVLTLTKEMVLLGVRMIALPFRLLMSPVQTLSSAFGFLKNAVVNTGFGFKTFGQTLVLFGIAAVGAFSAAAEGGKTMRALAVAIGLVMLAINPLQGVMVLIAAGLGALKSEGFDLGVLLKDVGRIFMDLFQPILDLFGEIVSAFLSVIGIADIFGDKSSSGLETFAKGLGFVVGLLQVFARFVAEILESLLTPLRLFTSAIGQVAELLGGGEFKGPGFGEILTDAFTLKRLNAPFGEESVAEPGPPVKAARGGFVRRPTRAIVGDNGPEGEAILPLNSRVMGMLAEKIAGAFAAGRPAAAAAGPSEVRVVVELDGMVLADQLAKIRARDAVRAFET